MLEKLLDILKAVGTYRAGFAFVAGIAFCFLGFFDIGDFKSITIRTQSVLPPVIVGSFLITVGLALHLMPKGRQRVPEDNEQSAGFIYVFRHVAAIGGYRPSNHFGYALYSFNTNNPARPRLKRLK
ncbi:hypothetical protein [Pseudomonas extremaustralis]|uniref:hypothetical protein n=1 Tax=Pseudomonas extremaustralis TaxID=359110 RepID=UPI002855C657|nr:hypothetical protein [Pseudomonas extremaustralis]MDR6579952.1 hypothetical protein [Pseudomonas extremaustralis]